MRLEISKLKKKKKEREREPTNIFNLSKMLLDNQWVYEKSKDEILKKYIEINKKHSDQNSVEYNKNNSKRKTY